LVVGDAVITANATTSRGSNPSNLEATLASVLSPCPIINMVPVENSWCHWMKKKFKEEALVW
jgi:hypothetical protein